MDGELRIGDPYTQKVSDPWNDSWIPASTYPGLIQYPSGKTSGIASVLRIQDEEYVWKTSGFTPPAPEKMVVYELLVRDFSEKHNFQGVIDSLAYLKRLGVNAVELMPVNEFEGNNSWGYNPNYYFAVDKYYGRKNDLKRLIDTLHSHGIAVILDVVYNHTFGSGPYVQLYWDKANNRPSAASPFYNMTARHDFNVGFDMNHESAATRRLVGRALKFWLEEFRVDGYRFDLSKGFTQKNTLGNPSAMAQYDASRIAILSGYADTVWSVNPQAFVILEHFAENTEEVELQSRGMMLWSNHNHAFAEGTMGYNGGNKSDLSWMSWLNRGFAAPRAIGYAESHDEERLMYKALQWGASNGGYDVKDSVTALQRMQLSALFLLGLPGPRMIWQFGELGYDYSIDYNGRTGEKPIRWDYFDNKHRRSLYSFYAAMNALRAGSATFHTQDFDVSVVGAVKSIVLQHPGMNAVIVGNFDVKEQEAELNFPSEGIWYDHFSGDSLKLKTTSYTIDLAPGQFHLFTDKKLEPSAGVEPIWRLPPQFEQGMLHIYPNPSAGDISFYLELPDGKEGKASLELSDLAGRRVGSIELTVKGRVVVPLSDLGLNLAVGTYLCTFSFDGRSETEKLIIK
ncbi:MAG: T9SS type A sorting domain-containing protein [Bacteroidales bacterium]|nr:T9SS type A sorting domain-containing protein [Bacteroidales bacterium]